MLNFSRLFFSAFASSFLFSKPDNAVKLHSPENQSPGLIYEKLFYSDAVLISDFLSEIFQSANDTYAVSFRKNLELQNHHNSEDNA